MDSKTKKIFGFKARKSNHIERKYKPAIKTSVTSILLMMVFVYSILSAEEKGNEAAVDIREVIENKEFHVVRFGSNKLNNIAYLYCGSRNCAGFDTFTNEIVYFPQNGHRIQIFSTPEM